MFTRRQIDKFQSNVLENINSPLATSTSTGNLVKTLQRALSINTSLIHSPQNSHIHLLSPNRSSVNSVLMSPASPIPKLPSLPPLSSTVKSSRQHGIVRGYCANTHKGLKKLYNEDRVMIISRIPKPEERKVEKWPTCSYFGIYDGHGGKECCNFLRDNLHTYIIQDIHFPGDAVKAITRGFEKAEEKFKEFAAYNKVQSSAYAIVLLIIGRKGFLANLGDSRGVISESKANKITQISVDGKRDDRFQGIRKLKTVDQPLFERTLFRNGPGRIHSERNLSGAGMPINGEEKNLVKPDIKVFRIHSDSDFFVLGSHGAFETLNNLEVVNSIWRSVEYKDAEAENRFARGLENTITEAMARSASDNLTLVVVAFENFWSELQPASDIKVAP